MERETKKMRTLPEEVGQRVMQTRSTEFTARDDDGKMTIEGYFAVFNSNYDIAPGMSESIAPGAFSETLGNDIRALTNHDTTLVLGRNKAHTLELKEDSHGLWGRIDINPNDGDAVNLYERVKRGDVDQCSFGFDIRSEDTDISENGDVHWTLTGIDLHEVSCCTFPAYEATSIEARSRQREDIEKRAEEARREKAEAWRTSMRERLKGEHNGTQSTDEA